VVDFGRVLTAMITPFGSDGEVNYEIVEALAVYLADHGSDTLVVCGTTGESPALSWAEEYELFQVVKGAVGDRAKVMAGTGSNSTHEAIEATIQAAELGLDGTLQVVPYYNKPPQEGLYQHFATIAQACPACPLMLYNVPSRTGCNLQPETVARLAKIPNIVAIKEASGDLDQASQINVLTPSNFSVYSGDDSLTLPLLAVGAKGVVSVASHLVGDKLQLMVKSFEEGHIQIAIQTHLKLFPLFKSLFLDTNPIPIKAALTLLGWQVGSPRPPLSDLSVQKLEELEGTLQDLQLLGMA
jgi:4-hydroxy-tetrahydrodipicolinate synthase